MSDDLQSVYSARTSQEAHQLKNLLEEEGIRAVVTNELLERGSGVDIVGWPTAPRVVVAEEDAPTARQIAEEFDRQIAARVRSAWDRPDEDEYEDEEDEQTLPDADWPTCPECDARRPTMCPICDTTGTDFPMADPDYVGTPDAGEAAEPMSCGCGSGGCSGGQESPGAEAPCEEPSEELDEPDEPAPLMRMCPTCDEPFVPDYANRCEWCGHQFADGYDVALHVPPAGEPLSRRAIAVIVVLLLLGVAGALYFALLL